MRKVSQTRKMVCSHCGTSVYTTRYNRSSRFGLPPCMNCGRKQFEPSSRSILETDRGVRRDVGREINDSIHLSEKADWPTD
jgi:NAD-dependent SIR2 family protein deacetylase